MGEFNRKEHKLQNRTITNGESKNKQLIKFSDNKNSNLSSTTRDRRLLQCYTEKDGFKVSENEIFKTSLNSQNKIWILPGNQTTIDAHLKKFRKPDGEYYMYRYNVLKYTNNPKNELGNFRPDCGWLATFLTTGNRNHWGLEVEGMDLLSTDANKFTPTDTFVELLKKRGINPESYSQNEGTDPKPKEAYIIGRTGDQGNKRSPGCNYHAAAVIAKDGSDNITCEADSGSRSSVPAFDMYSTKSDKSGGETFHDRYKELYTTIEKSQEWAPITTVAKPKNIEQETGEEQSALQTAVLTCKIRHQNDILSFIDESRNLLDSNDICFLLSNSDNLLRNRTADLICSCILGDLSLYCDDNSDINGMYQVLFATVPPYFSKIYFDILSSLHQLHTDHPDLFPFDILSTLLEIIKREDIMYMLKIQALNFFGLDNTCIECFTQFNEEDIFIILDIIIHNITPLPFYLPMIEALVDKFIDSAYYDDFLNLIMEEEGWIYCLSHSNKLNQIFLEMGIEINDPDNNDQSDEEEERVSLLKAHLSLNVDLNSLCPIQKPRTVIPELVDYAEYSQIMLFLHPEV